MNQVVVRIMEFPCLSTSCTPVLCIVFCRSSVCLCVLVSVCVCGVCACMCVCKLQLSP